MTDLSIDVAQYAAIFEEWKRRYDENPEEFANHEDFVKDPPKSYGEAAARYFVWLMGESW